MLCSNVYLHPVPSISVRRAADELDKKVGLTWFRTQAALLRWIRCPAAHGRAFEALHRALEAVP